MTILIFNFCVHVRQNHTPTQINWEVSLKTIEHKCRVVSLVRFYLTYVAFFVHLRSIIWCNIHRKTNHKWIMMQEHDTFSIDTSLLQEKQKWFWNDHSTLIHRLERKRKRLASHFESHSMINDRNLTVRLNVSTKCSTSHQTF